MAAMKSQPMAAIFIALSVLVSLSSFSHAQTCSTYKFTSNQVFNSCSDLPYLNAFLHWTFDQSTGKLQMAYRHTSASSSNWVSWAINPDVSQVQAAMPGAQALYAIPQTNGVATVYTSPISGYGTTLANGSLSYDVTGLAAEVQNSEVIIYATWTLPTNASTILQVWQEGPVSNGAPKQHGSDPANLGAKGTLDLLSGQTTSTGGGSSTVRKRNVSNFILKLHLLQSSSVLSNVSYQI